MLLLTLLLASLLGSSESTPPPEEQAVIKAAVEFARITPIEQTLLPEAMPSPLLGLRDQPYAITLGTGGTLPISHELVGAIREANNQRRSLKGVVLTTNAGHNRLAVSRPGISRDGSSAIVVIEDTHRYKIQYLEKRDGSWRVVAMGPGAEF
jgi:hypothetical protein